MEHFPQLYSRERSDAWVDQIQEHWRQRGYGLWAVERVDTNCFIGFVGLCSATFEASFTPCVEVGWRLAADQWGQGRASEGASVALEFGFTTLGLAEIVSFTAQTNVRSWRLMERLGMIRDLTADFEHPHVPMGRPCRPHVLYRISSQRWRTTR